MPVGSSWRSSHLDVLQGLEDPAESWSVRHASDLVGKGFLQGGEGFPETLLAKGIDKKPHRHDGDEDHDPGLFLEEEALCVKSGILCQSET